MNAISVAQPADLSTNGRCKSDAFILKRRDYVLACDRNHCAAEVLSLLSGWHQHRTRHGIDPWMHTTERKLADRLLYSEKTVNKALSLLEEREFIKWRRRAGAKFPYNLQRDVLFQPEKLDEWLLERMLNPKKPPKSRCSKSTATAAPALTLVETNTEPSENGVSRCSKVTDSVAVKLPNKRIGELQESRKTKAVTQSPFPFEDDQNSPSSSKPKPKEPAADGWMLVQDRIREFGVPMEPYWVFGDGKRVQGNAAARTLQSDRRLRFLNEYRDQHPGADLGEYPKYKKCPFPDSTQAQPEPLPGFPPAVEYALVDIGGDVQGGLERIDQTEREALGFVRREFIAAYEHYVRKVN